MKVLEARHIHKHFYDPMDNHVINDVSLEIQAGEFVSIMGKSGCGKSTLLYILSTMDTQFEGELFLAGKSLRGLGPNELAVVRSKHIGFVFQFHYLLPEFTVLENAVGYRRIGIENGNPAFGWTEATRGHSAVIDQQSGYHHG
jgi:lipoprotein-releasing system ATP-binding protein